MASIIAKRYASALFSLAIENSDVEVISKEATVLREALNENEEFLPLISHPQLSTEKKIEIIEKSFGDIHDSLKGLIHVMLVKNRFDEFYNTLCVFEENIKAYKNILSAKIISAVPLTNERVEQIKNKLSANLNKIIEVTVEVDENLIGGLLIEIDGRIIDGTVKKHFTDVRQNLLNSSF